MTPDPDRMKHSADTYPRWAGAAHYVPTTDEDALGWERLLLEGSTGKVLLRVLDDDSVAMQHVSTDGVVTTLHVWHPA
jgi:hypothetical protein